MNLNLTNALLKRVIKVLRDASVNRQTQEWKDADFLELLIEQRQTLTMLARAANTGKAKQGEFLTSKGWVRKSSNGLLSLTGDGAEYLRKNGYEFYLNHGWTKA